MPRLKFLLAGGLIIGALSYLMFSGLSESMVYYYRVGELVDGGSELAGRGVRVSGHVAAGSIQRETSRSQVTFTAFDQGTDRTLRVTYQGVIPDTFKDNAEVVVEGVYDPEQNHFQATTLLAKCPSKYEALGEEHPADIPLGETSY